MTTHKYIFKLPLFIFLLFTTLLFSQNNKQQQLENRRQELRREIQKINELQAENKCLVQRVGVYELHVLVYCQNTTTTMCQMPKIFSGPVLLLLCSTKSHALQDNT